MPDSFACVCGRVFGQAGYGAAPAGRLWAADRGNGVRFDRAQGALRGRLLVSDILSALRSAAGGFCVWSSVRCCRKNLHIKSGMERAFS